MTDYAMGAGDTLDGRDPSADGSKLDGIEALADVTDDTNVRAALAAAAGNIACNSQNITTVGTVDGRTLSTDGSKLDGIEDAADVTDATNVAAAGAVMDTDFTAADEVMVGTGSGTHNQVTLGASEFLAKKAAGAATNVTAAEARTILNVEDGADVTDATNVDAAGAVMESDFDAYTILAADTDDTPAALTVAASRIVGRKSTGGIVALTNSETAAILDLIDNINVRIEGLAGSDDIFIHAAWNAQKVWTFMLISDVGTSGSDGANNWSFQVRNLTQANDLLSTAAATNVAEITADTVWEFSPDQNEDISASDVLELQITKNGNPSDLSAAEILVIAVVRNVVAP